MVSLHHTSLIRPVCTWFYKRRQRKKLQNNHDLTYIALPLTQLWASGLEVNSVSARINNNQCYPLPLLSFLLEPTSRVTGCCGFCIWGVRGHNCTQWRPRATGGLLGNSPPAPVWLMPFTVVRIPPSQRVDHTAHKWLPFSCVVLHIKWLVLHFVLGPNQIAHLL